MTPPLRKYKAYCSGMHVMMTSHVAGEEEEEEEDTLEFIIK